MKLVEKLLVQGIEVQQARNEFRSGSLVFGPGSYVVSMAQPKMGVVRWLLGRTFYPDNSYTRDRDNTPIRPYDMATDTMAEFMGVDVTPVDGPVNASLVRVTEIVASGRVSKGAAGYVLDGRENDSFHAVNLLLAKNVAVRRADRASADGTVRVGDFLVPASAPESLVAELAKQTGVDFAALTSAVPRAHDLARPRVGMYQRYRGGNIDEGWTRFLLEQWGFAYTSLFDKDLKPGGLESKFDVIILPADSVAAMTGERDPNAPAGRGGFGASQNVPPEYRSGFGKEGVDALKAFVEKGGTLVTFGEAGALPIERFGLPLRNIVAGRKPTEFWCPGSTLRTRFDTRNPLAYGMPERGLATFLAGSQVYEITPTDRNEQVEVVASYADRDILQSGWLLGESIIAKKPAMVTVTHGSGRVVLIGFRPQHRAQTHGTFKLVFNALLERGGAKSGTAVSE
jgi:hypothetical protein